MQIQQLSCSIELVVLDTPFLGKTKSVQVYDYLSDLEIEQLTGYDSYSAMTSQFEFNTL